MEIDKHGGCISVYLPFNRYAVQLVSQGLSSMLSTSNGHYERQNR